MARIAYFCHFKAKRKKRRNKKDDQNWSCFYWSKSTPFPQFQAKFCLKGRQKTRPSPHICIYIYIYVVVWRKAHVFPVRAVWGLCVTNVSKVRKSDSLLFSASEVPLFWARTFRGSASGLRKVGPERSTFFAALWAFTPWYSGMDCLTPVRRSVKRGNQRIAYAREINAIVVDSKLPCLYIKIHSIASIAIIESYVVSGG